MKSHDQLIAWMGTDGPRRNAAAYAEQVVCDLHPSVERGSEQFYYLVLATVLLGK